MKILFLNQTFYPDVASTSQYAGDLAATLVERGHDVTVVCSRRAYDNPRARYPRRQIWRGVKIRRIWCSGFGKKARWRRAADFGSYIMSCVGHLATLQRFDVVVGMTSPPLVSWIGSVFAQLRGGRFVFWVMDLNPDEALAAGWLRPSSLTTMLLQRILHESLDGSTLVVVLDRFMARRIEKKGVEANRIVILPPWSHDDAVRYDAEGRERFRTEHRLGGQFVVMHSGNHSPCHPLATLLEAAERLRNRSDITFCFVGGGSELDRVRRFAVDRALKNIVVVPYQPLSRLAGSLSAADLHTVIMGNPFVGIVHPCKVYNIRAMGIPYLYIGPSESHVTELNPTSVAAHGDIASVVDHILTAAAGAVLEAGQRSELICSRERLLREMVSTLEKVGSPALSPEFRRSRLLSSECTRQKPATTYEWFVNDKDQESGRHAAPSR